MIRKICTAVAASAVLIGASLGMAGVANAATPVAKADGISNIGGTSGVCSILGGVLTGVGCPGAGHHVGGGFHGGHYYGGGFRGGRWFGGSQTIIVDGANYGVSDCGCGTSQVLLTPQVVEVPSVVRGIETGDGSCSGLNSIDFGRFGGLGGFHRGLHFVR
jgi:hypothetical protein